MHYNYKIHLLNWSRNLEPNILDGDLGLSLFEVEGAILEVSREYPLVHFVLSQIKFQNSANDGTAQTAINLYHNGSILYRGVEDETWILPFNDDETRDIILTTNAL